MAVWDGVEAIEDGTHPFDLLYGLGSELFPCLGRAAVCGAVLASRRADRVCHCASWLQLHSHRDPLVVGVWVLRVKGFVDAG